MKKILSILCVFFIGLVSVSACSSQGAKSKEDIDVTGSKYIGTWICKDANVGDTNAPFEDEIRLVLNSDATGEMGSAGEISRFIWQETDKGFRVDGDDINMTFKDKGDTVVSKVIGVELIFEKQK